MPEFNANPFDRTWTIGLPVPAGMATVLSAFTGRVQVKLAKVPVGFKHLTPNIETKI